MIERVRVVTVLTHILVLASLGSQPYPTPDKGLLTNAERAFKYESSTPTPPHPPTIQYPLAYHSLSYSTLVITLHPVTLPPSHPLTLLTSPPQMDTRHRQCIEPHLVLQRGVGGDSREGLCKGLMQVSAQAP